MPMRILQVARQFYPSIAGVENIVENLARQLIGRGHQCDVLTLNRCFYDMAQVLPTCERVKGIQVFRIPFWGRQRLFLAPRVLKFVKNYDIIHIHNVDSFADLLVMTKPWHRRPLVLSTQGGYFHTNTALLLKRLYFNTITRLTMRGLDALIAVSEHDRELFARVSSRLVMISDGIDYTTFRDIDKKLEPGLLVYVGRLASNKRVDNLLRAFAGVCRQMPSAHLVIVGMDYEGLLNELESLATQLGVEDKVVFTGAVSDADLHSYISRAHLFVSASEYESFGISVLEAMSAGTVPVVNDIRPFQAIITSGENGFLVDYSGASKAADVLLEALSLEKDRLREMGEKARRIAETYSWENVVVKLEQLYRELVECS